MERDYETYKEHKLYLLDDFYALNHEKYAIYLTNKECKHCENIKNHLLSYYDLKEPSFPIYYYDMGIFMTPIGDENRSKFAPPNEFSSLYNIEIMLKNKPNTLKDTYFCGTPSLYVIENNRLDNLLVGEEEVINFIDCFLKFED